MDMDLSLQQDRSYEWVTNGDSKRYAFVFSVLVDIRIWISLSMNSIFFF